MPADDHSHPDVLVLGEHPSAYLAAAMLRAEPHLAVVHATLPGGGGAWADRLVLVNPALFQLHPLLTPLSRKLNLTRLYGVRFLSDQANLFSQHRTKSAMTMVARYGDIRDAAAQIARQSGAVLHEPANVRIVHVDETGLNVQLDQQSIRAKALILANDPPPAAAKILGLDLSWDQQVMHRCFLAPLAGDYHLDLGPRPLLLMSLDLQQRLHWAWLLQHESAVQISVIQPPAQEAPTKPQASLEHWLRVLRAHGMFTGEAVVDIARMRSFDLPLAGALDREGVINRTLLIGPAGGFYSACAEDIYPNCWSAVFAVDVIRRALREKHLQDALDAYRHNWRTTLGDYLHGPEQNLRFLLPMIYRNQNLTSRMADSILLGKSMVR
jgi:flavin-dependent dehydrogenase